MGLAFCIGDAFRLRPADAAAAAAAGCGGGVGAAEARACFRRLAEGPLSDSETAEEDDGNEEDDDDDDISDEDTSLSGGRSGLFGSGSKLMMNPCQQHRHCLKTDIKVGGVRQV